MRILSAVGLLAALAWPALAVSPQGAEGGYTLQQSSGEQSGAPVGAVNADPKTRTAKAAGALGGGLLAIAAVALAISRSRKEGPTT